MSQTLNSNTVHQVVEDILQRDDLDRVLEQFGDFEKSLSLFVFFISAIPVTGLTIVAYNFNHRNLSKFIFLSVVYVAVLFFFVQYRFQDLVYLFKTFQSYVVPQT